MIGITSTMNGETTDNQKWPVDILLMSREVREQAKGLLEHLHDLLFLLEALLYRDLFRRDSYLYGDILSQSFRANKCMGVLKKGANLE